MNIMVLYKVIHLYKNDTLDGVDVKNTTFTLIYNLNNFIILVLYIFIEYRCIFDFDKT